MRLTVSEARVKATFLVLVKIVFSEPKLLQFFGAFFSSFFDFFVGPV